MIPGNYIIKTNGATMTFGPNVNTGDTFNIYSGVATSQVGVVTGGSITSINICPMVGLYVGQNFIANSFSMVNGFYIINMFCFQPGVVVAGNSAGVIGGHG